MVTEMISLLIKSLRLTFDSKNTDLAKVASIAENNKLRDTVVSNDSQFSLLDDVHLSANITLLTDVVSRTVDLRLQF